ncbi:hypothetical protein ACFHYS_09605 [Halalkalibacter oceani]
MSKFLVFICLLSIWIIVGCYSDSTNLADETELSKAIMQETGKEMKIPTFNDLDISYVYVQHHANGDPSVNLYYTPEPSDDIKPFFADQNNVTEWEEAHHAKTIVGPYDTENVLLVTLDYNGIAPAKEHTINSNGTEVTVEQDGMYIIHSFSINNVTYKLAYDTSHYFSQDNITDYTSSVINNS